MPYPFWNIGLGYGIVMALVAVIHVFVSHFAIGGGLYLVLAERSARKAGDEARLDFVRRLSKFFLLLTVVFGALSGVGIWFIIGLLNPMATEALIHNFVWAWAIEWTFFIVEILAAILYFYGWKRLSPRNHMVIGWIYFVSAWLSLVAITGIITFMLTPGAWLETGSFWDAFLNPTFASSVALRTGICLVMAGLFALLVASRTTSGDTRVRIVRYSAVWAVAGLLVAGASWFWYRGAIPVETMELVSARLTIPADAVWMFQLTSYFLLAFVAIFGLILPRSWNTAFAALALLVGLCWFGSFEWFRESIRKPFAIHSYMYGNGMPVAKKEAWRTDGLLPQVAFRSGDDGADLFRYSCRHCHTLDGYNAVLPAFNHTDATYVRSVILNLEQMRGSMPPFMGNEKEAETLANWIWERADKKRLAEVTALRGKDLGKAVYDSRCSRCHVIDGFNDKTPKLEDFEATDLDDLLQDEEGLEGMPPFTGSEAERKALLEFLGPWLSKGDG